MAEESDSSTSYETVEIKRQRWFLTTAFATIVLSLVLLVVTPLLVQHRARQVWSEVRLLQTAAQETQFLNFLLARQMSSLRSYFAERDEALLDQHEESRVAAEAILREMDAMRPQLAPGTVARYERARELVLRWHAAVDDELSRSGASALEPGIAPRALSTPLFETTLRTTGELQTQLAREANVEVARLGSLERAAMLLQTGLMLLALVSTGLVFWIGARLRTAVRAARRLHAEAVKANAARARMLRGVTHDLKNPLGAARMYTELLSDGIYGQVAAGQDPVVARIRASIDNAIGLIDDLLELGQVESGNLTIERVAVPLGPLLGELRADYAMRAATERLTFSYEDPAEACYANGDPTRIRQILQNLLGNAVKYTPAGGSVRVRVETGKAGPAPSRDGWVAIAVEDTGPGIPREERDRVFEEFVRLSGTTGGEPGNGVGLSISRHLARSMGGDIILHSEVGVGSTFTLWLRAAPREIASMERATA